MRGAASLLLTRTLYMLLIVLGATLAGLPFPFSPRGSSLLALVTVGLPGLAMIAWARPVPWRGGMVGSDAPLRRPGGRRGRGDRGARVRRVPGARRIGVPRALGPRDDHRCVRDPPHPVPRDGD